MLGLAELYWLVSYLAAVLGFRMAIGETRVLVPGGGGGGGGDGKVICAVSNSLKSLLLQ